MLSTTRDNQLVVLVLMITANLEFKKIKNKKNLFWSNSYNKNSINSRHAFEYPSRHVNQRGHITSSSNRKVYKNFLHQILVHARYVHTKLPVEVHAFFNVTRKSNFIVDSEILSSKFIQKDIIVYILHGILSLTA